MASMCKKTNYILYIRSTIKKNNPCRPGELIPALSLDAWDTLRVFEKQNQLNLNQNDHA